jgi:hypothetical protein
MKQSQPFLFENRFLTGVVKLTRLFPKIVAAQHQAGA